MERDVPILVFIIIAAVTPILAFVGWLSLGRAPAEPGEIPLAKVRRNLLILALAGPANLLLWFVVNGWLDRVGSRSVIGYVLAAAVFLIGGFVTGFLPRLRQGGGSGWLFRGLGSATGFLLRLCHGKRSGDE